jgi:transposase-like protein
MILTVSVFLNEIYHQGRKFKWKRPKLCPRCGSVRVWGHGFVAAFFDGFDQCVYLRRYRCADCNCVIRLKPKGYFSRFRARIDTIRECIYQRVLTGNWTGVISRSRQRHWLSALKKKALIEAGCKPNIKYYKWGPDLPEDDEFYEREEMISAYEDMFLEYSEPTPWEDISKEYLAVYLKVVNRMVDS